MDLKRELERHIRGWLPSEPHITYASRTVKPRWHRPKWIAFTLATIIILSSLVFVGARTYIRYSNPQADITASYFEKSLNCTTAKVGDTVEVSTRVGWHGYILPEFERQVQIVDPYPEGIFMLVGGNNTWQYSGYGGSDLYHYQLKVINSSQASVELPKPKLYLDNTEVPLSGERVQVELTGWGRRLDWGVGF